VAVVSFENFPCSQGVHSPDPLDSLNFPPPHSAQGPPSAPVYPGKHAQSFKAELPGREFDPGGQDMQALGELAPGKRK